MRLKIEHIIILVLFSAFANGNVLPENLISGGNLTSECPSTQNFDPKSGRCLFLIGQPCRNSFECFPHSICSPEWNSTHGIFNYKCRCAGKSYFLNPSTQACQETAKYGESCNEINLECQVGLTCNNQTHMCTCENPSTQIYDPLGKCGIRVGELCFFHQNKYDICIPNASCEQQIFSLRLPTYCKCNPGFLKGDDRGETCLASHMQTCNGTNIKCHKGAGLICTDGQCLCESPLEKVFDQDIHKCVGVIGGHCNYNSSSPCVKNAVCDAESSKCVCAGGFNSTTDGRACKLDFGELCNSAEINSCNYDRGLVCKNKKCVCYDPSLTYNSKLSICTNQKGRTCGKLNQSRIQRKGQNVEEKLGNSIVVGCEENLVCARMSGKENCVCSETENITLDPNWTNRSDLCL